MKKLILATTALVSVSGAAMAQESGMMSAMGNTLNIGGYYEFGYRSYNDDTEMAGDTTTTYGDSELFIDFATVTDNGLEYGVQIDLEIVANGNTNGATGAEDTDEASLYVAGEFGRVVFGNDDPASDSFQTWAPTHDGSFGQDDGQSYPQFAGGDLSETIMTFAGNPSYNDASKIAYFSPSFSGFNFGISWQDTGDSNNAITYGASYAYDINDSTNLTFTAASADNNQSGTDERSSLSYGATLALNDLSFTLARAESKSSVGADGTDHAVQGATGAKRTDAEITGFGIGYAISSDLSVGAYFAETEEDKAKQEADIASISAQYVIAPGLTATIAYNSFDITDTDYSGSLNNNGNGLENSGSEVLAQVEFSF